MKILQFTLGFQPAFAWGGPVKIVHLNSRELVRRGHQVTVYCTNLLDKKNKIQPKTFEDEFDGIRVVYFNTFNLSNWPGTLGPAWSPDLISYLRKEITCFDLVHINGYRNLLDLPVAHYARRNRLPFVIQSHGVMQVIINSILIKRIYDYLLGSLELRGLSALIAGQQAEKQQAINAGIPEDKIIIIPNGIETSETIEYTKIGVFRNRFGIPVDKPLILFLGRINPKKGTDMLIEAFHKLNDPNAHLAIVGPDDGQLNQVKQLIKNYHLENRVRITGLLNGDEVIEAYIDSDIFVLPCRTDTFPLAIVEACKYHKPMVITDQCEIAELVKDRVAEVVPFDADLFAEGIRRLLNDRRLYNFYQDNCQIVLEDTFSLEASIDKLEALYYRVVEERARNVL